ncbi:MAG: glyoxalase/bleomycin resistance/extradiol dioxygenase family protein [Defluviitaleaceae bacterium]|nr:glyoxalase/bleomycin resistance/extradiol dioxygenase family protein [Defluviitaleaceae bacterium]
MKLGICLSFGGNCKQAVEFYAKVFGATDVLIMKFGDMPPMPGREEMNEEDKAKICHAEMTILDQKVIFSDLLGEEHVSGTNMVLSLTSSDEGEIRKAFEQLSEGATIQIPLGKTFFSTAFGTLTDMFGTKWHLTAQGENQN